MWEDPLNRDGGRWILNLEKKHKQTQIDAYWLNTLLGLIGDQFYEEGAYVNGAVINLRPKLDKICLWTRCARDQEVQNRIG
jgi:translation initiation factor 4E